MEEVRTTEVHKQKDGDWRVESIVMPEGTCEVTIFAGYRAHDRAILHARHFYNGVFVVVGE